MIERLLEHWSQVVGTGCVCFDTDGELHFNSTNIRITAAADFRNMIYGKEILTGEPVICNWTENICFGFFEGDIGGFVSIGPFAIHELERADIWSISKNKAIFQIEKRLPNHALPYWQNVINLIYQNITGRFAVEKDLAEAPSNDWEMYAEYQIQQYHLDNVDECKERNSYAEILPLLDAVKHGNREEFYQNYDVSLLDRIGKLASSSKKQTEYLAVKMISLFMHAMIDGGLDYNRAYDSSDLYLQKLEKCVNTEQMVNLSMEYTNLALGMMQHHLENKQAYDIVEEAKNYIANHLRSKIEISEMAKELKVNASYLSRRFSEKAQMTIQQYILTERIHAACNLLKFSDYDIAKISNYLCFSSQSHFSSAFRKLIFMTPSEYRKQFGQFKK